MTNTCIEGKNTHLKNTDVMNINKNNHSYYSIVQLLIQYNYISNNYYSQT